MRLPTGVVLDGIDMTVDNSIKRSVFEKSPSRAFWDGVVHYVGRIFIHRAGVLKITQANLWMGNVPSYSDGESVNKNSTVIISIVRKEEEIIYSRVSNSFDGKWGNEGGSDYVFWHVVCRDGYYRKKIFILFFSNWLEWMVGLVFFGGKCVIYLLGESWKRRLVHKVAQQLPMETSPNGRACGKIFRERDFLVWLLINNKTRTSCVWLFAATFWVSLSFSLVSLSQHHLMSGCLVLWLFFLFSMNPQR